MPCDGSAGAGGNSRVRHRHSQTLLPEVTPAAKTLPWAPTMSLFEWFFACMKPFPHFVCEFIPNKCVSAQESGLCRNSEVRANAPIEQPFREIPLGEVFNPTACQLGNRGKKGANLKAMLSSHSRLCPCVINPEDNSNDLKKLVYFNKMYQVRRVAFITALM